MCKITVKRPKASLYLGRFMKPRNLKCIIFSINLNCFAKAWVFNSLQRKWVFATNSNCFSYILATKCRKPLIFQTMNSVRSNSHSLKFHRLTPSESEFKEFEPRLKSAKNRFQISAGSLQFKVEPTIFKPRLKFMPRFKFLKFGLWLQR